MLPILPLLVITQSEPSQGLLEIRPRTFVLPGKSGIDVLDAARTLGLTHIIDLRTSGEGDSTAEATAFRKLGGVYIACPVSADAFAPSLDHFRPVLASLPPQARVLVRCASGNRAGAALFAYWVMDQGIPVDEAMVLAKRAGLRNPSTEKAVLDYVKPLQTPGKPTVPSP